MSQTAQEPVHDERIDEQKTKQRPKISKRKKNKKQQNGLKKNGRSTFIFFILFLILTIYTIGGGVVFYLLEADEQENAQKAQVQSTVDCTIDRLVDNRTNGSDVDLAERVVQMCFGQCNEDEPWTWVRGVVLAYAAITTIGYGSLITNSGQIFYIFYCLIGMPLGLLFLGHFGKFIEEGVGYLHFNIKKWYNNHHRSNKISSGSSILHIVEEEEFEMGGLVFLLIFFVYIAFGLLAICLLMKQNVVHGVYINFNSLTAIDATKFFNVRGFLLILALAYVTSGLALATVAIGILSTYLKKLRSWGKKYTNLGKTMVWFGGRKMTVKNLVDTFGEHWGVDEEEMKMTNLDKVIIERLDEMHTVEGARAAAERRMQLKIENGDSSDELGFRTNRAYHLRKAAHEIQKEENEQNSSEEKNERNGETSI